MIRNLLKIGILLFVPLIVASCAQGRAKEVIAIRKTATYHRVGCPPVNMAKTEVMTVVEARHEHLRPCVVCKPDSI